MMDIVKGRLKDSIDLKTEILGDQDILNKIIDIINNIHISLRSGQKIIFAGNGGSFADSIHLSTEFIFKFKLERHPIPSMALGTNNSTITAISNDYSFENIFERELRAIGQRGDVFIGISTSGTSINIIKAVEAAIEMGLVVFCLTGETGGKLNDLCPCLKVPSNDTPRIQEVHITIGHIICEIIEQRFRR